MFNHMCNIPKDDKSIFQKHKSFVRVTFSSIFLRISGQVECMVLSSETS